MLFYLFKTSLFSLNVCPGEDRSEYRSHFIYADALTSDFVVSKAVETPFEVNLPRDGDLSDDPVKIPPTNQP